MSTVSGPLAGRAHRHRGVLRVSNPILWGLLATVAICAAFVWMASLPHCPAGETAGCPSKWAYLLRAPPHEVADTFAGFAASLTFVWIIVTVFFQAQELSLTRKELEGQKEAAEQMAASLACQAEIFRLEQEQREEQRREDRIAALARLLLDEIAELSRELRSCAILGPDPRDPGSCGGLAQRSRILMLNSERAQRNFGGQPTADPDPYFAFDQLDREPVACFRLVRKEVAEAVRRLPTHADLPRLVTGPWIVGTDRLDAVIGGLETLAREIEALPEHLRMRWEPLEAGRTLAAFVALRDALAAYPRGESTDAPPPSVPTDCRQAEGSAAP